MNKLFSINDYTEEEPTLSLKETDMGAILQGSDFSEEIDDLIVTNEMVTESIELYANQITLASKSAVDLQGRKLGSVDYLVSVENYKIITDTLTNNLGIKKFIPSLEDFSNQRSLESSHEVALEGFIDFIKKVWQKIKDFFMAFFKKINQFIRRISGANLEIDSYEKYVDDLIRKIKKNKLVLGDNKAKFESRLPALMADLGIEEYTDYSEVLSQSTRRMDNLAMVLKQQYDSSLLTRTNNSIKNIRDTITGVLEEAVKENVSVEKLKAKLDLVKKELASTLADHYVGGSYTGDDVPSEVNSAIMEVSVNRSFKDVSVLALIPPSMKDSLPKHYNAFLALNVDKGSFITTHSEKNDYVNSQVPAIGTIESLENFHKTYKEFVKSYNLKGSSDLLNKLEKSILDTIGFMMGKYATTVNIVENNVKNQEVIEEYSGADPYERLYYLYGLTDKLTKNIKNSSARKAELAKIGVLITETMESTYKYLSGLCNSNKPTLASVSGNYIIDSKISFSNYFDPNKYAFNLFSIDMPTPGKSGGIVLDHEVLSKEVDSAKFRRAYIDLLRKLSDIDSDVTNYLDHSTNALLAKIEAHVLENSPKQEDPKEILDTLSDIQDVVLPFLNTFKSHIVSTTTSLTAIYTESRAASIKYIYDSARLYH